jgi:hypothetical protein
MQTKGGSFSKRAVFVPVKISNPEFYHSIFINIAEMCTRIEKLVET